MKKFISNRKTEWFVFLEFHEKLQSKNSAESDKAAKTLSFVAPAGCILLVIPSVIIGAGARVADWSKTDLAIENFTRIGFEQGIYEYLETYHSSILPLALKVRKS